MNIFKLILAAITGILLSAALIFGYEVANEEHIDGYIIGILYLLNILSFIQLAKVENYDFTVENFKLISLFLSIFPFCYGAIMLYGYYLEPFPIKDTFNIGFERDFYFPIGLFFPLYAISIIFTSIRDFYFSLLCGIDFYKTKYRKEITTKYYYADGSKQFGPFTLSALKTKNLSLDTYVWTESMTEWKKIKDIPDLKSEIASSLPPPLPPN